MSADGRFIAFGDDATNLVANDTASGVQLFVRDMQQGTTTLITAHPALLSAKSAPDGSTVVFQSGPASLVPGVSGSLYAYHVQTQITEPGFR